MSSALGKMFFVPVRAADRVAARVADAGWELVALPLLIGAGLGIPFTDIVAYASAKGKTVRNPFGYERAVVASMIVTALVASALVLVTAVRHARGKPGSATDFARSWLRRLAFVGAFPLFGLFARPLEGSQPWLMLGAAAIAGGLVSFSAYHWFSEESRPSSARWTSWLAGGVVTIAVAAYAYAVADLAIANHLSFNTGRSDLAYYVNIFRQSSQGIPLGCSICGGNHLTGHFDPILVILSPIYLIYPFAETILILQAVWLGSGAIPVYLLARQKIGFRGASVAFAAAYLTYPALHGVNLFDFHSLALCVPLFLWLLYFFERRWSWAYSAMLLLVLLVREDMPFAVVGVGLYAIFSRLPHGARYGWSTLVAAVAYFVVAKGLVMGRPDPLNTLGGARGYANFFEELVPTGTSTLGLIGTLLTNPVYVLRVITTEAKLLYVVHILLPLLFLPLFGRGRAMLAYGAALTLLASRPYLHSINFQYSSVVIPFVFSLALGALGRIRIGDFYVFGLFRQRLVRALSLGVLTATLLASWDFGAFIRNGSFHGGFRPLRRDPTPEQIERAAFLKTVSKSFPKGTRIASNSRMMTHLGNTTHIYLLDGRLKADYVVTMPSTRFEGREIAKEVENGQLVEVRRFKEVRVYKTKYPKDVVRRAEEKERLRIEARRNPTKKALDASKALRERAPAAAPPFPWDMTAPIPEDDELEDQPDRAP